jgi:hypothetical protein
MAVAAAFTIAGCAGQCRLIDTLDVTARGWDTLLFSLPAVALTAAS